MAIITATLKQRESSQVLAVHYDESSQRLTVAFPNGSYEYPDVPLGAFCDLLLTQSLGSFVHTRLKNLPGVRKVS